MRVALTNHFHAGDIIMSRAIIRRVRPLLVDKVALHLECKPKYQYLWADLGLPMCEHDADPEIKRIDLWFAHGGDLLGVTGMTHATHVTSYNRQAKKWDLPQLNPDDPPGVLDLPMVDVSNLPAPHQRGVLVENGPVLSGQRTHDINGILPSLGRLFPRAVFYCTGPLAYSMNLPPQQFVDCSSWNLIQIATVSHHCSAMLSRLSGPFIATLTQKNVGRLKRLVYGEPIGCPIWDERDVEYFDTIEKYLNRLEQLL